MLRVLVIAVILRRGFQPPRLGVTLVAMISLASGVATMVAVFESTPRGGANRCRANLMTNDAELNKLQHT